VKFIIQDEVGLCWDFMARCYRCSVGHINFSSLFGLKLGFSQILDSLYGAFWRCSCVRL